MATATEREAGNEAHWKALSSEWLIRTDTTYLNHGSFGATPEFVASGAAALDRPS